MLVMIIAALLSCISPHHLPRSSPAFLCITTTHQQMSLQGENAYG
jgi:hypothetical protein